MYEGDEDTITLKLTGVTSSLASPTMAFYKRGQTTDVSSTYFTGSMTVSGLDTVVSKTTTGLKAGEWTLNWSATVDGVTKTIGTTHVTIRRKSD